jgi:ADP-ribosylarginine hydrolase
MKITDQTDSNIKPKKSENDEHNNDDTNEIEDKFYSIMMLHALGDTLGFKNGDWEFNYNDPERDILGYIAEIVFEFLSLGGVNGINLDGWRISDDTILHLAIGKAMLDYHGETNDKFIKKVKHELSEADNMMIKDLSDKNGIDRYVGITTRESISKFTDVSDGRTYAYNAYAGGNGAAMRSLVIGMCLFGEKNRLKLIDASVTTSILTHNNAHGYLAGLTSALFTAFALEKIPISEWPIKLIDTLKTDDVMKYRDVDNEDHDYDYIMYMRHWKKYIDTKFFEGKPIRNKSFANPMYRVKYFYDNFYDSNIEYQIGGSGYLCMIMAYDALLDCDGIWEKLILYAILHSGDSDTIGSIAAGLYGAVYALGDVSPNMIKYIENKNDILSLTNKLYEKYGKHARKQKRNRNKNKM